MFPLIILKIILANNNKLFVMENKIQLLQEEKDFMNKKIKYSKKYNAYLKRVKYKNQKRE